MLVIKKLRYRNFLSSSSKWVSIDFEGYKTTLVVGKNGSGKTSFIDALCFVLYNKPFRNINKPLLINSISRKGAEVECEFTIGGHYYIVRRGMKPNIFEIYCDGSLVKQLSENFDYQTYLEKTILKMSYKTFIQIVIQGSDNYVPFMRLTAQARREFIDNLLELEVFSTMAKLLKTKAQTLKENDINNESEIRICESKIEMNKKHLRSLKQNHEELILQRHAKVKEYEAERDSCSASLLHSSTTIESLQAELERMSQVPKRLKKVERAVDEARKKVSRLDADSLFFEANESCPTCTQTIDAKTKEWKQRDISFKKNELLNDLVVLENEMEKLDKAQEAMNVVVASISNQTSEVAKLNQRMSYLQRMIQDAIADIEDLKTKITNLKSDDDLTPKLQEQWAALQNRKKEIAETAELYGWALTMLKDEGIKTRVVRQYIPIMNRLINEFLDTMDFFVSFHLDDNFKEVIKSRYRDEFSYESFSAGEKVRIDLALLFCWRAIAKMRNSASCSLLIMDETFDGSLDYEGIDDFIKIIQDVTGDTNVVVISHKTDQMLDKFDRALKFTKVKNFSQMEMV